MAEFSKKSAPVSASFIDSNAWCRYLQLWWMSVGILSASPSSSSSSFTVAFVQVIMKSVREACDRPFSLALAKRISCHVNSDVEWVHLSRFISCCFIKGRGAFREFSCSSFINCNIVSYFWACASLLRHFATGGLSTKPQERGLVYFAAQTRYQSGSECGSQQCYGYVKRFYLTVTDIVLMNQCRLLR